MDDFIKYRNSVAAKINIQLSTFGLACQCDYVVCNRFFGAFPKWSIDAECLAHIPNGGRIFLNCVDSGYGVYRDVLHRVFSANPEKKYVFYIMIEPEDEIVDILRDICRYSLGFYVNCNVVDDPRVHNMPIGIRDGEELLGFHRGFSQKMLLNAHEKWIGTSDNGALVSTNGNGALVSTSDNGALVSTNGNGALVSTNGNGALVSTNGNGALVSTSVRNILCLLCFSYTHQERHRAYNMLANKPFITDLNKDSNKYGSAQSRLLGRVPVEYNYEMTARSVYAISPRGCGEATHRFFEAIYLGCIPVVKRTNTVFDRLYVLYPCLVVDDWDQVTEELLTTNQVELQANIVVFKEEFPGWFQDPTTIREMMDLM